MAKITRIKASDGPREKDDEAKVVRKRVLVKDKESAKARRERAKADAKKVSLDVPTSEKTSSKEAQAKKQGSQNSKLNKKVVQSEKSAKKPFILFRPFVALGHYLRDSWRELRQVRWPNRKATWQMLVAVILYAALFMVIISVLDLAFSGLSNLILNR